MPNVLLLMTDEHNPRFSSPYGDTTTFTPNMQWLAEHGSVYERAYCPGPICATSRSAFMSGKRVHQIQAYNNFMLPCDHPTYGRVLNEQGVHAVHVGRTDVYNIASRLGFSQIFDTDKLHRDRHVSRRPLAVRKTAAARGDGFGPDPQAHRLDLQRVDQAIHFLTGQAVDMQQPWVLSVNLMKPHFPHKAPPPYWNRYDDAADLPAHGPECATACHPFACDHREHFQTSAFTEQQIRGLRRGYRACVTFVDDQLGRLLETLEQTGLLDNTLVVYTSDHGDMLGKFGMWWDCSLLEDSVRVPLIVAGAGFTAGQRVKTPVDLHDLQAAIFRAVGAVRPKTWVGAPLQDIPADDPQRVVFSEHHGHAARASCYMIRKGAWKLIYCIDAPHQLFNLQDDPEELHNLFDQHPKSQELVDELYKICDPQCENDRAERHIQHQLRIIERA